MRRAILLLFSLFATIIPLNAQLVEIEDGPTDMFLIRPAVIEFTAEWCTPSQELAPTLKRLAREYAGRVDFYTVDVEGSDFFQEQGFRSIPILLFLYDYDDESDVISYFGVPNLISYSVASSHVRDLLSRWNQNYTDRQHYVSREYVDLGLSVMWATCNLGARSSSANGAYYAWGETSVKHWYDIVSYKYTDQEGYYTYGRYYSDETKALLPEDDVATITLGDGWHIPTYDQWVELIEKCTWEETTVNGKSGWRATGPNGNSLFLPYAGIRYDCYNAGRSDGVMAYWTNEVDPEYTHRAYYFGLTSNDEIGMDDQSREYGFSVRAVKDK